MNKTCLHLSAIFILCIFISSGVGRVNKAPLPGKYATCFPGDGPTFFHRLLKVKNQILLEQKHKKDFKGMLVITLYLREDSSFLWAYCTDQIEMAGKYIFERDSLRLYDVYNFAWKEKKPDIKLCLDKKGKSIYYIQSNVKDTTLFYKKYKYKERVTVLQHGKYAHHRPVIRNENWSLDSIYKFNTYWELKKQLIYFDSVQHGPKNTPILIKAPYTE